MQEIASREPTTLTGLAKIAPVNCGALTYENVSWLSRLSLPPKGELRDNFGIPAEQWSADPAIVAEQMIQRFPFLPAEEALRQLLSLAVIRMPGVDLYNYTSRNPDLSYVSVGCYKAVNNRELAARVCELLTLDEGCIISHEFRSGVRILSEPGPRIVRGYQIRVPLEGLHDRIQMAVPKALAWADLTVPKTLFLGDEVIGTQRELIDIHYLSMPRHRGNLDMPAHLGLALNKLSQVIEDYCRISNDTLNTPSRRLIRTSNQLSLKVAADDMAPEENTFARQLERVVGLLLLRNQGITEFDRELIKAERTKNCTVYVREQFEVCHWPGSWITIAVLNSEIAARIKTAVDLPFTESTERRSFWWREKPTEMPVLKTTIPEPASEPEILRSALARAKEYFLSANVSSLKPPVTRY